MVKLNRKEDATNSSSNDIDIISIGTLYRGCRWEKKYWSSSRGKDRHPYPVGYQAARTYNGIVLTMEVQQGNTGPLFAITSNDGQTISGQTPNIVWNKFQRACSPLVKSFRGKRLSADIDGTEFFGFKYKMVQQLLRQVVAAANQGTRVPTKEKTTQVPNQSTMSSISRELPKVCMEDKGGEKRKIGHMEMTCENKPKKVRPLNDTTFSSSYCTKRDGCIYEMSSTAATDNFAKPHLIERQTMEDGKFCASLTVDMLNGINFDPPSILRKEKLSHSHESDDALIAEGSPTQLSQDQEEEICMSNPNIKSQNDCCDSVGEEITMSMMKLLLPQAVPLIRKARRTKKKNVGQFPRVSSLQNILHRDHAKDCSTADAHSMDGELSNSICQDLNKTKQAFESSKAIVPDSFDTKFNDHVNLEQLPDVADSCDELDYNACIPGSCDELANNAYVPDSLDELGDNAYAPDSCDELDDKETIPDSCKELTENHYISDSCDKLHEIDFVPDSCGETDENENLPVSPGLPPDVDVKMVTEDRHFQVCEGKEVPCSSYSGIFLSSKSMDRNEANNETPNLESYPKRSGCDFIFSENEDRSNDHLKPQGSFNLASQQQHTNRSSHIGITNDFDELNGGTCPVFRNGCQSPLNKCVRKANLKAGPNQACAPNHNLFEKVITCYEADCSGKHDEQCRKATGISSDMQCSSDVLQTETVAFAGIRKFPGMDIVNTGVLLSDKNASSKSEALHLKQSTFADTSNVSAGQRASDDCYSKLSIAKEGDNSQNSFGKFIGLPGYGVVAYEELLGSKKNVSFKSQTSHNKQSASVDDSNMSGGPRALVRNYSKQSMVKEHESKSSGFGKRIELPSLDMVNSAKPATSEKNESSEIGRLYHRQSASVADSNKSAGHKAFDGYNLMSNMNTERDNKLSGFGKLVGLYAHPTPVLSVLLCSKENEIYICTSCGNLQDNQRTLFMYKLKIEGPAAGSPYFVGHSAMLLPDPKCFFGRQIAMDKSGMQFTPDGQSIVLLNGIQVPSCRNGSVQCQCVECASHSSEENAVKIVQLKHGYVTVLAKLKTADRVLCLLVCEPNYLVAVEASGAFHFWTMNTTWRYVIEDFFLPPTDCISPCVVELKQIPNCPHLVVGHNCLGEFGLWDVSRHTIISRFFIPDITIFRLIPVSLYRRNRKDNTFTCLNSKEQSNSFKNSSKLWSSQHTTSTLLNLSNEKDIVISILVATCPDIKSSYRPMPDGCWKLGLLMNHKVFLKHSLDVRAVSVTASGVYGVLGTSQGYLHVWDLSTGLKLGASLCFKDGRVECLYTDCTRSGLLAVADDKGKVLLYSGRQEHRTL
ncbi:unnamed protein product [Rhodiola kirilowii]